MENERFIVAIGRIERALSRVEMASKALKDNATNPALEKKHEVLKGEAKAAISMIDALIGKQER